LSRSHPCSPPPADACCAAVHLHISIPVSSSFLSPLSSSCRAHDQSNPSLSLALFFLEVLSLPWPCQTPVKFCSRCSCHPERLSSILHNHGYLWKLASQSAYFKPLNPSWPAKFEIFELLVTSPPKQNMTWGVRLYPSVGGSTSCSYELALVLSCYCSSPSD
jgi:hypothetical protein